MKNLSAHRSQKKLIIILKITIKSTQKENITISELTKFNIHTKNLTIINPNANINHPISIKIVSPRTLITIKPKIPKIIKISIIFPTKTYPNNLLRDTSTKSSIESVQKSILFRGKRTQKDVRSLNQGQEWRSNGSNRTTPSDIIKNNPLQNSAIPLSSISKTKTF